MMFLLCISSLQVQQNIFYTEPNHKVARDKVRCIDMRTIYNVKESQPMVYRI